MTSGIRIASALLLGILGIAVLAYAGTELVIATDTHSSVTPALLAFLGGAVLALAGFGLASSAVVCSLLLATHFFLIWTIELQQTGSWATWPTHLAVIIWPIVTYQWCKRYYRRRATLDVTE